MIDRVALKSQAKEAMRGRKPSVYLVVLAYLVINFVLQLLDIKLQFPGMSMEEILDYYLADYETQLMMVTNMPETGFFSHIVGIAVSAMGAVLAFGITNFCLLVSRGKKADVGSIFDVFGIFFKIIWLNIVIGVKTFLWSLLLVVPGIIAAYRYSMAMYILLDDPDKSVSSCIEESKALTMGHKAELFILDLSFIGWNILTVIPFVGLFVLPYYRVTVANYYNVLSGYCPAGDVFAEAEEERKEPWDM